MRAREREKGTTFLCIKMFFKRISNTIKGVRKEEEDEG
jgi:hypothetical protein